ncbi:hypothetical protein JCM1841_006362 [Sporobolomyces salmonicolor]
MLSAPLRPFVFPPPSSSSTDNPTPLPSAISAVRPGASIARAFHRHSEKIHDALDLLRRLSDQADAPAEGAEGEDNECIISNLESHGWIHQTTTNGIRIFQLEDSFDSVTSPTGTSLTSAVERVRSVHTINSARTRTRTSSPVLGGGAARRGIRADEALPFFRGEGWIEGNWRREDVAATLTSIGARAVWDPRFDATNSRVVELLSETDMLVHMHIRGTFVANRDACIVNTHASDERRNKENILYVAGCSVEDPLVPRGGTRTTIHLNGFALRSLPRPPNFEPPLPASSPDETFSAETSPPNRPSHRRTKSSVSAIQSQSGLHSLGFVPPLPTSSPSKPASVPLQPLSAPLLHTMSASTVATSSNYPYTAPSDSAFPFPATFNTSPSVPLSKGSLPPPPSLRPGLAVSMLVRASPGYNLPQTTVNQLSVHLPLSIAAVGRFLGTHGFAPYLVREGSKAKIREEEFDVAQGRYRVVFTVDDAPVPQSEGGSPQAVEGKTRIRFYGSMFGRGRFVVEVRHVKPDLWRVEYDVPSLLAEEGETVKEQEELGEAGSGRWTSSLSVVSDVAREFDRRQGRKGSMGSITGDTCEPRDDSNYVDPALLPGPLGGCTLVIPTSATTRSLPVIVTITRPCTDPHSQPLAKMRGMSRALAHAAQVALDDNYSLCDSVEQLLECGREGGEERAEMCLRGARMVLSELQAAGENEGQRARGLPTSSFLFGGRKQSLAGMQPSSLFGGREQTTSPRSAARTLSPRSVGGGPSPYSSTRALP